MDKLLIVMTAGTLAAKELAPGTGLPLTTDELWSLLFVFGASLFTAVSKEASKANRGPIKPVRFWGNVGLGVMGGMCMPLLLDFVFHYFTSRNLSGGASIGLGILGAYAGQDVLKAGYGVVLSLGEAVAKLKGVSISYDASKVRNKKKDGEDDA
ncbi:hypothetical protein GO986_18075 [Deinococcus sp. HMF7620]|uniref:Holin n=1 Tax=Deinococcus arboris TaxID=2682977 RepID=A0A7C9HTZ2_9DEIO|nr:hypothetical protein [Deinococcus arboris]MVN88647.1 hypothetical protein [Deinococcus arboris]